MANWKNYFYYQKGDKIAIILLLVLIVVSGSVLLITKEKYDNASTQNDEYTIAFEEFQSRNAERVTVDSISGKRQNRKNNRLNNRYPHQVKLKNGETIDLNRADTTDLKKIPGIGTAYANRIVKYRNLLGGYVSVNQLREVYGIDDELYENISSYVTIGNGISKININSSDINVLKRHPYINYKQAAVIVDIRSRKGRLESLDRLSLLDEFSDKDIDRLKHYLFFD